MEQEPHQQGAEQTRPSQTGIKKHHNRLKFEKSPYLLQHADNPIDWYPWGPEAFEKALKEDKPIFLSIGYSTCHWCHVMEHESFEDLEVAALLNEIFVCIKVDREERPDIDTTYMTVCQMMTGSGGWPLTIIMTADKKPFFAGTYFPKESRFGRIGIMDLAVRVKDLWASQRNELLDSADQVTAALQKTSQDISGEELSEDVLGLAYEQLAGRFDERYGGFGDTMKFPTPHNFLFLLRHWRRTGDDKSIRMVEETLQAMRHGGIYDHVGFGFHRYSTDPQWRVPHFEKMLYDQALLAMAYTEAYQATRKEEYKQTAEEIFTYVLRDMTAPTGGFYSAEDADSEGEEGKFYLWTEDEIRQVLEKDEADLVAVVFNVEEDGNFLGESTGSKTGKNILHMTKSLREIAAALKMSEAELRQHIEEARQKLLAAREARVHPYKDDKVLTDWNGLMIAALAKGARVLDEPAYAEAGKKAVDFILSDMRDQRGRVLHRYRDGQAALQAHVDDYAFLIWGLMELYETTFEVHYLETALDLTDDLVEHFWDERTGGFYFTADDAETVLVRPKETYDGAVPSGNSVAALNMLRLARITSNPDIERRVAELERAVSRAVKQSPSAHTQMLVAADFRIGPSYEVVIAGDSQGKDTRAMLRALRTRFLPGKVVILRPTEQDSPDIVRLANYTENQKSIDGKAAAYVCQNYSCKRPTTDIDTMLQLLDIKSLRR